MKILTCFLLVLALAAAAPLSAQTVAQPENPPADPECARCAARRAEAEKEVLEFEQKWCEAEAAHDAAFLEKVEADTFTYTDASGRVTTKKDEIAAAKAGGDKIEFKLSDMKAQIYGDTAVLTGQTSFVGADADSAPGAYRWTDVFVRQTNGEWQVVASHASALNQEKPAR